MYNFIGNVEISQGSVWVAGYNMATQTSLGRSRLGLCPQHNVIFDELTVREHLEFFTRLKGYNGKDLYHEIDDLIDRLEMQDKVFLIYNVNGNKSIQYI